ncbi:hypothetical protein DSM112329_02716 [Paraconexibacter sp. AEG42_29]|uniref:Glycosyltransferase family 2 protein n=1 Tax=Paraconexibacter sp. AEG42_29 TaxID=2997339 RepID=A0AAU7AW87_9ACTN
MPSAAVSVVVVSWNTAALLDTCLQALRADHESGLADVTVVDNDSADGSAELVAERHPWVRLVRAGANLGYGPAINLGAAQDAPGPAPRWLVPANADVAVHPGALARLVATGDTDPGVAVVAPRLLLPDGSTQHHVHPFPSLRTLAALHLPGAARVLPAGRVLEGAWDPDRSADVDWAHGALLLVRRGPFDAIGGFDAAQWLYAEDVDIAWRLARAGWRTRYEPGARVTHAVSAAAEQAWADDGAREDRKQAATYAWMRSRYGRRRTAVLALAGWASARGQARRAPAGWRRDRALAHAARHAAGLRSLRHAPVTVAASPTTTAE